MIIIPALDLMNGQIVRLQQGDYDKQTKFTASPIEQFEEYVSQGAKYLHLVDLDGAKDPAQRQLFTIKHIVEGVKAPIQVGGGIRTKEDVQKLLDIGVERVVVGSTAIQNPEEVKSWFDEFGADSFVLALDTRIEKGKKLIAISGWLETTDQTLESVIESFLEVGLEHVLCTDISKDGMLQGSNVKLYKELVKKYPNINFQASGGIGGLEDLEELNQSDVYGVIVGRALLENKFTTKEAIACLQK